MAVVRGGCGGAGGRVGGSGTRQGADLDQTESCVSVSSNMYQQRAYIRQQDESGIVNI